MQMMFAIQPIYKPLATGELDGGAPLEPVTTMIEIHTIGNPPRLANGSAVPLSPAVRTGNLIFVSGQLGLDENGQLISPDVGDQVRQCIARIASILAEAGSDLAAVVKATVWLSDSQDFAAFNAAYRDCFPRHLPARSTVVSELLIPGAKVEIEVIAVASPDRP